MTESHHKLRRNVAWVLDNNLPQSLGQEKPKLEETRAKQEEVQLQKQG